MVWLVQRINFATIISFEEPRIFGLKEFDLFSTIRRLLFKDEYPLSTMILPWLSI